MNKKAIKIKHLINRASFGLGVEEFDLLESQDYSYVLNQLFSFKYLPIEFKQAGKNAVVKQMNAGVKLEPDQQRLKRRLIFQLQDAWMNEMCVPVSKGSSFLERMSLFWHGHFACRIKDFRLASIYLETIRKNALGNFKDLLLGIAQDPAMIRYLNNQQNTKKKPNENFARELLELFSMGIGHYSEKDIKEAARAFTGWSSTKQGTFKLKKNRHDNGVKLFLGQSGNFGGEEIIDIILQQKQTSTFIVSKLYSYFVNAKINKSHVTELAETFVRTNFEIIPVMKQMFTSEWFYDSSNIGSKVKSPIDLIIGLRKLFNLSFPEFTNVVYLQRILGQELLSPPNVAGWERDLKWINSATLVYRLKLGHLILNEDSYDLNTKTEEEGFNFNKKERNRFSKVKSNVKKVVQYFGYADEGKLNHIIESILLATKEPENWKKETKLIGERKVLEEVLHAIALPEYQFA